MEAAGIEIDLTSLEADPKAEVEHLRRLLDKQPSCLMRVAASGELLAANEASLRLLGVERLAEALGKPLTVWLPPEQHPQWAAFSGQVIGGSPASIECDIRTAGGEFHVARFNGVSLTDHPDGIISMVLAARDATDHRQLERSLNEMTAARARLAAGRDAERAKVQQGLEALRARYRVELQSATTEATLRQTVALREEHEAALRRLDSQRLDLQAQLDQALADRLRIESALAEAEHAREAFQAQLDEVTTDRSRLEEATLRQAAALREEHEAVLRRLDSQRLDLQAQLDQALADRHRLDSALADAEARLQQLAVEREADRGRFERDLDAMVERHGSELREAKEAACRSAAQQAAVESGAQEIVLEREQFWAAIEQSGTVLGQLTAERDALQEKLSEAESHGLVLEGALRDAEVRHQQGVEALARDAECARSTLQAQLDEAVIDRRRLEATLLVPDTGGAQAPAVTAIADAATGPDALARTAADQAIALHALAEQVRRLSPLAAVGRVGREIAPELHSLVREAEAAATRLLSACPIDHPHRPDAERLRADAIQAAALAGELLLASGGPDEPACGPLHADLPRRRT
jgi:PAS domain S-box-containing protein